MVLCVTPLTLCGTMTSHRPELNVVAVQLVNVLPVATAAELVAG
jgi:hypothetical protein